MAIVMKLPLGAVILRVFTLWTILNTAHLLVYHYFLSENDGKGNFFGDSDIASCRNQPLRASKAQPWALPQEDLREFKFESLYSFGDLYEKDGGGHKTTPDIEGQLREQVIEKLCDPGDDDPIQDDGELARCKERAKDFRLHSAKLSPRCWICSWQTRGNIKTR